MFIYQIKNKINGKIYIGSAVNFDRRKYHHIYLLNKNIHRNLKLQNSWNKHGEDNFEFYILEKVIEKENLFCREQHWMDLLGCVENGYNIATIAGSTFGIKLKNPRPINHSKRVGYRHTEETKKKISQSRLGKTVIRKRSINLLNKYRYKIYNLIVYNKL